MSCIMRFGISFFSFSVRAGGKANKLTKNEKMFYRKLYDLE